MTGLIPYPQDDSPEAPHHARLQLGEAEPLGEGIKRVTLEQLEHAASGFFDGESVFGEAVHRSRKSIKRVRAILRLVRDEIPGEIFAFENRSLRDTSRLLSEVRATQGVLDAAASIRDLYGDLLAHGMLDELVERLTGRRDLAQIRALEDPNLVGRVVRNLERAHKRYSAWPTDPEAREVYGIGIRDRYSSVRPGLNRTYSTGRHHMARAYRRRGPVDFHEWRKKVKDARHQMEFLSPVWPEVVVGTALTLDRLGSLLGEDNDLSDLLVLLRQRGDLCPDPRVRSVFRALALQRRSELQIAAEILGRRVYAEPAGSFSARFGEYWESRTLALESSLDTIVVY